MHPLAQSIVAVFVGLVVLGPATIEEPPEALSLAPILAGVPDVDIAKEFPFTLVTLGGTKHRVAAQLVAQDDPRRPEKDELQRLAKADKLRISTTVDILNPLNDPTNAVKSAQVQQDQDVTKMIQAQALVEMPQADRISPEFRNTALNQRRLFFAIQTSVLEGIRVQPRISPNGFTQIMPVKKGPVRHLPLDDRHAKPTKAALTRMAAIYTNPNPFQLRMITGTKVNVRTFSGLDSPVILQLNTGDSLFLTGKTDGPWSEVLLDSKNLGWVYNGYLGVPQNE